MTEIKVFTGYSISGSQLGIKPLFVCFDYMKDCLSQAQHAG